MRKLLIFALSFVVMTTFSQQKKNYESIGLRVTYPRDSLKILNFYTERTALLDSVKYTKVRNLYNLAINHSLLNQKDSAFYYLNKFLDFSEDDKQVLVDKGFNNLHQDSLKWKNVVNRIEDGYLSLLDDTKNKNLALQLFYMDIYSCYMIYLYPQGNFIKDGNICRFYPSDSLSDKTFKVYAQLEEIITKYGFPTLSMVGRAGNVTASAALFCAPTLPYPKKYHKMVEEAFRDNDFDSLSYAKLTDRSRFLSGKPQIYGTEWIMTSKTKKKYGEKEILYPVKDFKNINKRREEMGFKTTIEEYAARNWIFIPPSYY